MPIAAIIIDSTGKIVRSNIQLEYLFDYTNEELQGSSFELLIPVNYHSQYSDEFERFIKKPDTQVVGKNQCIYGRHKNGLEIPVEINLGTQVTQQGIFLVALITDVTEHYWTQLHLQEKENRLTILLESTSAIPWAADPISWQFTYVGSQAAKILGYPIEYWYKKDFWINKIHPDDRKKAIKICTDYSKVHRNYELEYRMIKANGDVIWLQDIVNVEFKNGEPFILRGFLIDVTMRKQTDITLQEEKHFSDSIIDSLPGLFFMIDREYRYVRWNKNYEKLIGCSGEELVGRKVSELVSPETLDKVIQGIETGFQEGVVSAEYENLDKDGKKISYAGYGVRTSIGGHDYLVGIEIDISKQKEMERKSDQLRNELAHVNRMASMGELAASIAHELNQPLTAIMSNAQAAQYFLKKKPSDTEETSAALTDIINDNRRASEIIKHLRQMFLKNDPIKTPININDLVVEVIKFMKIEAMNRGVSIEFKGNQAKLAMIMGSRIQLQQIMINIMMNAFDAMSDNDNGSRNLLIDISKNNDDKLVVKFIDNGAGFIPEDINQIFDAFYTSKQKGMGMGLTISRSIIEAHGGKLEVMKNDNNGVTVYFTLPIVLGETL